MVLCTDGLWNYAATADELGALVSAQPDGASAAEVATALVRAALTRGGHDNVTVAVVDLTLNTCSTTTARATTEG